MCIKHLKNNWCIIIPNVVFILIIALTARKMFDLNSQEFTIIFSVGLLVVSSICWMICNLIKDYLVLDENDSENLFGLDKFKNCLSKNTLGMMMTFLITIFLTLTTFYIYNPVQISFEPKVFEETIILGNQSVTTISIKNIGADLKNVTLKTKGIKEGWLSINPESFKSLKNGESEFTQVFINISQNDSIGMYRGEIILCADSNGRNIINVIPLVLHVKKSF